MKRDVATRQVLALVPGTLVLAEASSEVNEVEEFLPGEVGLLQQIASVQFRHGSILVRRTP